MCGNEKGGKEMFVVNGDMFGKYVKIPHVLAEDGEKFIFKVVGRIQSNAYYNVPIGGIKSEYKIRGAEMIDVLHVIQCGIDETEVLTVALKDCEFVEPRTNAEKIKGMSVEELAEFLDKVSKTEACGFGRKILFDEPCKVGGQYCRQDDFYGNPFGCKDCFKEWLESECDAEC